MNTIITPAAPCGSTVAHGKHAFFVNGETEIARCPGHQIEKLRPVYGCPDWCVREDHDADHVGPGCPPVHYAESIGSVHPQSNGFTDEVIVYIGDGDGIFSSNPNELRRVAADMLKGAEWLETRR